MSMASTQEITNTVITTTGIVAKILPRNPGTNNSGAKATMLVRIENVIGSATSRAPVTAASVSEAPRSRAS